MSADLGEDERGCHFSRMNKCIPLVQLLSPFSPASRESAGAEGLFGLICQSSLPDSLVLYWTEVCAKQNLCPQL